YKRELEGVPIVRQYKYLGVLLGPTFTLKYLEPSIEAKLKKFKRRAWMMMPSIICLKTRLELWQAYVRCYFDYFMSALALCGQSKKFQSLYTTSLKKALHLPLHLPRTPQSS